MVETRGQRRKAVVIQAKPLLMTHPRSCCNRNFASFLKKTFHKQSGAGTTLGQSANWRGLSVNFPPLARVHNGLPAPMQKQVFLGVCSGNDKQEKCCPHGKGCNEGIFKA